MFEESGFFLTDERVEELTERERMEAFQEEQRILRERQELENDPDVERDGDGNILVQKKKKGRGKGKGKKDESLKTENKSNNTRKSGKSTKLSKKLSTHHEPHNHNDHNHDNNNFNQSLNKHSLQTRRSTRMQQNSAPSQPDFSHEYHLIDFQFIECGLKPNTKGRM